MIEKSVFDNLLTQLSEAQKDILAYLSGRGASQKFMGNQVVTIQYTQGNYSSLDDYAPGDGDTSFQEKRSKKIEEAKAKLLEKNPDATWEDVQREIGEAAEEYDEENEFSPSEEWEAVVEKIEELPKDKVLQFESDF